MIMKKPLKISGAFYFPMHCKAAAQHTELFFGLLKYFFLWKKRLYKLLQSATSKRCTTKNIIHRDSREQGKNILPASLHYCRVKILSRRLKTCPNSNVSGFCFGFTKIKIGNQKFFHREAEEIKKVFFQHARRIVLTQ